MELHVLDVQEYVELKVNVLSVPNNKVLCVMFINKYLTKMSVIKNAQAVKDLNKPNVYLVKTLLIKIPLQRFASVLNWRLKVLLSVYANKVILWYTKILCMSVKSANTLVKLV